MIKSFGGALEQCGKRALEGPLSTVQMGMDENLHYLSQILRNGPESEATVAHYPTNDKVKWTKSFYKMNGSLFY